MVLNNNYLINLTFVTLYAVAYFICFSLTLLHSYTFEEKGGWEEEIANGKIMAANFRKADKFLSSTHILAMMDSSLGTVFAHYTGFLFL